MAFSPAWADRNASASNGCPAQATSDDPRSVAATSKTLQSLECMIFQSPLHTANLEVPGAVRSEHRKGYPVTQKHRLDRAGTGASRRKRRSTLVRRHAASHVLEIFDEVVGGSGRPICVPRHVTHDPSGACDEIGDGHALKGERR